MSTTVLPFTITIITNLVYSDTINISKLEKNHYYDNYNLVQMTRSTTFSILDFLSIHSAFPYTRLHALSSLYCILYLPSFVFIVNSCLMVFNLYVSIYFMLFFLAYNFSLRQFHQQYAVATVSSIVTTVRSLNNGGAVVSFV